VCTKLRKITLITMK